MIYQTEKRQKAIKKICANAIARKSIYFRRNLCINGKSTEIKVVKVKSQQNFSDFVLDESLAKSCLVFEHTSSIKIGNPKNNLDVVGTNYNNMVLIVSKFEARKTNVIDWESMGVRNIWLFNQCWVKRLGIKINSIVSTKSNL